MVSGYQTAGHAGFSLPAISSSIRPRTGPCRRASSRTSSGSPSATGHRHALTMHSTRRSARGSLEGYAGNDPARPEAPGRTRWRGCGSFLTGAPPWGAFTCSCPTPLERSLRASGARCCGTLVPCAAPCPDADWCSWGDGECAQRPSRKGAGFLGYPRSRKRAARKGPPDAPDPVAKVSTFYANVLPKGGWHLAPVVAGTDRASLAATCGGGGDAIISVARSGSGIAHLHQRQRLITADPSAAAAPVRRKRDQGLRAA